MPDRILRAMDMPTQDHRGPDFGALGKRALDGMKTIFKCLIHLLKEQFTLFSMIFSAL